MKPAFFELYFELGIAFFIDNNENYWFSIDNIEYATNIDRFTLSKFLVGNPGINTPYFRRHEYKTTLISISALMTIALLEKRFAFLRWLIDTVEKLCHLPLTIPEDQKIQFARAAGISFHDIFPPAKGE